MPKINLSKIEDLRIVPFDEVLKGSSAGILTKARLGSKYIKLGSYSKPYGFYGIEPIMELINSRIGEILHLPVLRYELIKCLVIIDGVELCTLASVSQNYVPRGSVSISIEKFCNSYKLTPLEVLRLFSLQEYAYKQFLYDFIILNMDRHGKNSELLVTDNRSVSFAPFFDNSLTFIFNRPENDIKNKVLYNDKLCVNNYIGDRNLLSNLFKIDIPIVVRCPRNGDRAYLFQGLSSVTTRYFRDYVWYMLLRRVEDVSRQKIPSILWK